MRRWIQDTLSCLLLSLLLTSAVTAQTVGHSAGQPAAGQEARSGDPWVDRSLADINRYGERYPDAFVDELTRYLGAPRALVESLLSVDHLAPSDVYFACALAQLAGQPCRAVVERRRQGSGEAWSTTAQAFGIAPGSPAFDRLKQSLRASYARWGRTPVSDAPQAAGTPLRRGDHHGR